MIIGKHLNDLGYSVAFAGNGWEGLLSLDKELPGLVILDGAMPGMDGQTFSKDSPQRCPPQPAAGDYGYGQRSRSERGQKEYRGRLGLGNPAKA